MKRAILLAIAASWISIGSSTVHADSGVDRARQRAIDQAIDRARTYLVLSLREGKPGAFRTAYPLGYRALAAYALLDSGASTRAKEIQALFADMDQLPLTRVYGVAIYVMALDAALRRQDADEDERRKSARALEPERLKKRLELAIEWLVRARHPGLGMWGYLPAQAEEWKDFSNTQFAVLALRVGLNHGVEIPPEVFREVGSNLMSEGWAAGPRRSLTFEGPGWWREAPTASLTGVAGTPVRFTPGGTVVEMVPMGWGYRRGRANNGAAGQYSMVAAATSSLMVARHGLDLAGELDDGSRSEIDEAIAGGLLGLESDWASLVPTATDTIHRNYYYTLYSFEKAMDLGGVTRLGSIDWYREHSILLIKNQDRDGAWGGERKGVEYRDVSTCFAILFLKRATRFLRVDRDVRVVTGDGGDQGAAKGRLFVPSLEGVVELGTVYRSLADLRTQQYLDLAKELSRVADAGGDAQELLPHLLLARNGKGDAVDRFVRSEIERLSGLDGRAPDEEILTWLGQWRQAVAWGGSDSLEARHGLEALLANAEELTEPLRFAAITSAARRSELAFVPVLIPRVGRGSAEEAERAHAALVGITGRPYVKASFRSKSDREELEAGWAKYWASEGDELRRGVVWRTLRRRLEEADDEAQRRAVRAEIIALGDEILPRVDQILARNQYAFDWVLIRHAITGSLGGATLPRRAQ